MADPLQATSSRFISLDTDFGYDALGGIGRLGSHRMEVLQPGMRQTNRIPGPPHTVGRWFSRLLDYLTPASWRAQGKFQRGLEDFSAQTGRLLGYLHEASQCSPLSMEREKALTSALRELAQLRDAATPMTRRGADYAELLQTRVRRNMAILRDEQPQLVQAMRALKTGGLLDTVISRLSLNSQGEMIEDLTLIRDAIYADEDAVLTQVKERAEELKTSQEVQVTESPAKPQPYHSRFSLDSLRSFFLEGNPFKAHTRKILQEREAALSQFSGEARNTLLSALDTVNDALKDRLTADAKSFAQAQALVDEKMNKAIRCAMNDVCEFALSHLDTQESTGRDGQDFQRIEADFVREELRALNGRRNMEETDAATPQDAPDDARKNPALHAIRTARQQIRDISTLYGELTEGIGELERRDSRYRCSLLLHDLAQTRLPESIDPQDFGEACDTLIAALQDEVPDDWAVKQSLALLERAMGSPAMPEEMRARFNAARPELMRNFTPQAPLTFQLPGALQYDDGLSDLKHSRKMHQAVGHAGAILQRSRLPQADSLVAQGLQISRLAMRLRTAEWREAEKREQTTAELRSAIGRFMANLTLAQMQILNPNVRSAQPEAKELDQKTAQEGIALLQQSVEMVISFLKASQSGVVARAALNDGRRLLEKGVAAARACDKLNANLIYTEKAMTEQLAVCLESGRDDSEATLRSMLEGSRWNRGKHSEARKAVYDLLDALRPVRACRDQSQLLRFLSNRLLQAFTPHDVYMGFDGNIHMLIDADRQGLLDSKKVQGTRWIILQPPESLKPGVSTSVQRLDNLLSAGNNRERFYPEMYRMLKNYFSGKPYNFSLPGDQSRP